MADEDDENRWQQKLDGKAAPSIGVSKDVVRAARALNPTLASQGSTTELLSKMKGGKEGGGATALPGTKAGPKVDFATTFYGIQEKYQAERKEVQAEIARLQKRLTEFAPAALEQVISLVVEVDSNMTSDVTKEIFRTETGFLNEIGFSVRKVIDRRMKKK